MAKIELDLNAHHEERNASVTIKADVMEIDVPSMLPVAEAVAENLKRAIAAEPRDKRGQKWRRTGRLASGITAQRTSTGAAVVPPSGRLESDEVREKFADEFLDENPLASTNVKQALEQALDDAITVRRKA
jgi:hypothetical protein